jgi:hypothetical protein
LSIVFEFLSDRLALPNGPDGVETLFPLIYDGGNRTSFRIVMVLRNIQDDGQKSKIIFTVKIWTSFVITSACFIYSFTARNSSASFMEMKHVPTAKEEDIGERVVF